MAKKKVTKRKVVKGRRTLVRKKEGKGWDPLPKSKAKNAYDLLGEIILIIIDEPKRYDQTDWKTFYRQFDKKDVLRMYDQEAIPGCGTVGCVSGWVDVLKPLSTKTAGGTGRLLGLAGYQERELFDGCAADGDGVSPGSPRHAANGVRHIARFMIDNREQLKKKRV